MGVASSGAVSASPDFRNRRLACLAHFDLAPVEVQPIRRAIELLPDRAQKLVGRQSERLARSLQTVRPVGSVFELDFLDGAIAVDGNRLCVENQADAF